MKSSLLEVKKTAGLEKILAFSGRLDVGPTYNEFDSLDEFSNNFIKFLPVSEDGRAGLGPPFSPMMIPERWPTAAAG